MSVLTRRQRAEQLNDPDVANSIDGSGDVGDVWILEAADYVHDGIDSSNL